MQPGDFDSSYHDDGYDDYDDDYDGYDKWKRRWSEWEASHHHKRDTEAAARRERIRTEYLEISNSPDDWWMEGHRTVDADAAAARQLAHDLAREEDETATLAQITDDAKVTRHKEEIARQLRTAILLAGEGGWRSPFSTGPFSTGLTTGPDMRAYQAWREARDSWTTTGDERYLRALTDAVDFTIPPEAGMTDKADDTAMRVRLFEGSMPAKTAKRLSIHQQLIITVLAAYLLAFILVIFL